MTASLMAHLPPRLLLLTLTVNGTLLAQGTPTVGLEIPRDPLAAQGQGLLLDDEPDIVRRFPGEQSARPDRFGSSSTAGRPRYRIYGPNGVFDDAVAGEVRFDAISTGNDLLPTTRIETVVGGNTTYSYRIGFAPGLPTPSGVPSWVNVVVSLDQSSPIQKGYPAGDPGLPGMPPWLRSQMTSDLSADLYSYWFEHNAGTGTEFIDQAYLVNGHEHLGLQVGDDISGIDTAMQFLADSEPDGSIIRVDDELYFSVTPGSLTWLLTSEGYAHFNVMAPYTAADITAATVFKTTWTGTAWSDVEIAFAPWELHAPGEAPPTDVDAIAFDAHSQSSAGYVRTLLFSDVLPPYSTAMPEPAVSQIRMLVRDVTLPTGTWVGDAVNGDGIDLRNRIGVRNIDDVDAICNEDPHDVKLSRFLAAPVEMAESPRPRIDFGLSVVRVHRPRNQHFLHAQLVNLTNLTDQLPTDALGGNLEIHIWVADPTAVNAPPGTSDRLILPIGTLSDADSQSIQIPIQLPPNSLDIALQAIYLPPPGTAPQPVYLSWRMVMRL